MRIEPNSHHFPKKIALGRQHRSRLGTANRHNLAGVAKISVCSTEHMEYMEKEWTRHPNSDLTQSRSPTGSLRRPKTSWNNG